MKRLKITILSLVFLVLPLSAAYSAEFRAVRPILTPSAMSKYPGAVRVMRPLPRRLIEKAVAQVVAGWNEKSLEGVLGDEFYDSSRLEDAMSEKVARDAELKVLSIQGVQTLGQRIERTETGKVLVSTVSARVRTQIEFNDPVNGFQRREGTNEYVFTIRLRL